MAAKQSGQPIPGFAGVAPAATTAAVAPVKPATGPVLPGTAEIEVERRFTSTDASDIGHGTGYIPARSKIHIEPADGFDTFPIAALDKKHVALIVTSKREAAD
jgi:hypothetical protein